MAPGKILVEWGGDGRLNIKTSLSPSEDKKLLVNVLLDAAKALNDTGGSSLLMPPAPVRILGGAR